MALQLEEPYRSEFCQLIAQGAGSVDIHGQPVAPHVHSAFIQREQDRADQHLQYLIPTLKGLGLSGATIADIGCSTGGTTAALAASFPAVVSGVDVNPLSISAAKVRLKGLGLTHARALHVEPGPLPFEDRSQDLVVCISVLEFVPTREERAKFLAELQRITGRYLYLATPSPYLPRELHTRRWFGNHRVKPEYPWASTSTWIAGQLRELTARRVPGLSRWQRLLFMRD